MRDFVSKVKERIFGDAWCAFLLHRLELDGSHDMNHCCQTGETCTSGDSEVYSVSRMGTALSPAMLQRVQGIAETISLAAGTSHRHEDSFKNVGIRSLQLNGVEPFNFDSVVDPVNDQSLVQEVEGEKEQKETIEGIEVISVIGSAYVRNRMRFRLSASNCYKALVVVYCVII